MKLSEYLLMPALSSSIIHTLVTRSAAHAAYQLSQPSEPSKEMDAGSIAHRILLEGHEDGIVVCDFDDWRKNEAKAMRDNAREGGKIPILAKHLDEIRRIVDAAKGFIDKSSVADEFARAESEKSIKWEDDGVKCKARFDRVDWGSDLIFDYKTCGGSINPKSWNRQVISMGYEIQAAFYLRGYRSVTGREGRFVWLAQETEEPYFCCLMDMAPDMLDYANSRVERGIEMWRQATATGKWPAYPNRICSLEVPGWARAEEEAEQLWNVFDELQNEQGLQP